MNKRIEKKKAKQVAELKSNILAILELLKKEVSRDGNETKR